MRQEHLGDEAPSVPLKNETTQQSSRPSGFDLDAGKQTHTRTRTHIWPCNYWGCATARGNATQQREEKALKVCVCICVHGRVHQWPSYSRGIKSLHPWQPFYIILAPPVQTLHLCKLCVCARVCSYAIVWVNTVATDFLERGILACMDNFEVSSRGLSYILTRADTHTSPQTHHKDCGISWIIVPRFL